MMTQRLISHTPLVSPILLAVLGLAIAVPLAQRNLGMYVLLADDTTEYGSTRQWQPKLFSYQQTGSNVLFFTFINPDDLPNVPPAFANLAKTRGSREPGSVPANTTILFALGGEAYSTKPNPWKFLETKEAAEAMASKIAQWPTMYGCDGIDMDIETGAGAQASAVENIVYFASKLKELNPQMIFTQPVFGSPSSVPAANAAIEASFNASWPGAQAHSYGSVSRVGIMIYSGTGALQYLDNYVNGCRHCTQWYCPLAACVPEEAMVLGGGGGSTATTIQQLAQAVVSERLGGVMVWYTSVMDAATNASAVVYGKSDDASDSSHASAQSAWASALAYMLS